MGGRLGEAVPLQDDTFVNLAFLLTPVADVVWLPRAATVREAIDSLRAWRYTAVPVLDPEGRYTGTVTAAELEEVKRRREHVAVSVDTEVGGVLKVAAGQSFVPVIDSRGVLMGAVTRRVILEPVEQRRSSEERVPLGAASDKMGHAAEEL